MLEYRFAKLAVAATFLLLLIGGTVNPTGSSLACPEPTLVCHGQVFPAMTGGVLYEHGHRLAAMSVGLLQIMLTLLLWRRRPKLKWLGVAALVMVCLQGTLGAITVKFKLPTAVSVSHLMLAFSYFATLIYIAWRVRPGEEGKGLVRFDLGSARKWVIIAASAVFAQILLGALMRHTGAALACIDLPLCGGKIVPATDAPMPLVVHMLHRLVGVIVGLVVVVAAVNVYKSGREHRLVRGLAIAAPLVVAAQIALGFLTIYTLRSTPVAVAHFAGATLLWGIWVTMFLVTRPQSSVNGMGTAVTSEGSAKQLQPAMAGERGA